MLTHKTHPKVLVALQEVSDNLASRLRESLPVGFHLWKKGELAFIHNKSILTVRNIGYNNIFKHFPYKIVIKIKFSIPSRKCHFWLVVVHVPGDPKFSLCSRRELANYLQRVSSPDLVVIAMGDMNFTAKEIEEVLSEKKGLKFKLISPYPTNINPSPERFSKCIDHIVVINSTGNVIARGPNEVLEGVDKLVDLLKNMEQNDV